MNNPQVVRHMHTRCDIIEFFIIFVEFVCCVYYFISLNILEKRTKLQMGFSSLGRAPPWRGGGTGIEALQLQFFFTLKHLFFSNPNQI